jgi:hypothetical protein
MTQDVACWDAGCQCAEEVLGPGTAPCLVTTMIGLMRALRAERKHPWQFMPATCCRVTAHECALVALIGRGRRRLWDEVGRDAAAITGRTEAPRLVAAVRDAVETINAAARQLGEARPSGTALH